MTLKLDCVQHDNLANSPTPLQIGKTYFVNGQYFKVIDDPANPGTPLEVRIACVDDIPAVKLQECGQIDLSTLTQQAGDNGPEGPLCGTVNLTVAFPATPCIALTYAGPKDCTIVPQLVKGTENPTGFDVSIGTSQTFAAGEACIFWIALEA